MFPRFRGPVDGTRPLRVRPRWALPDYLATAVSGNVVISGGPPPPPGSDPATYNDTHPDSHAGIVVTGTTAAGARAYGLLFANARGHFTLKLPPGCTRSPLWSQEADHWL